MAGFAAEVARRWDLPRLAADIRLSQRRRKLVQSVHGPDRPPRWNHGETPGQATPWYRGEASYNDWAFQFEPEGG